MKTYNFSPPDEDVFRLWQAVFALVHVDGDFSDQEKFYVERIVDIFAFTDDQKAEVHKTLKKKMGAVVLFKRIEEQDNIRQFFVMARTIIWCDGIYHELEATAIEHIVQDLGDDAQSYEHELRWINRKPILAEGSTPEVLEKDLIQIVTEQMSAFYKEKTNE